MNRNPYEKPSLHICPKEFCFFWRKAGNSFAPGLYENINEAMKHAQPIFQSGCGCNFGTCVRNEREKGEKDWYEPVEPELERQGLPWFYFCDPQKLDKADRMKYNKHFKNT